MDKVQTTTKVSTTANTTFTFEEDDSIDGEEDQYVIDQMTQAAFRKCGTVEVATKNDKNNSDEQFALGVLRKVRSKTNSFIFFITNIHFSSNSRNYGRSQRSLTTATNASRYRSLSILLPNWRHLSKP